MQTRYRLANPEHRVPMPERGHGVFFTADPRGEGVDPMNPFYARMIADGDLVSADPEPEARPDPARRTQKGD